MNTSINRRFQPLDRQTKLLPGMAMTKRQRNRRYMMKMTPENLLRAHYLEAGLIRMTGKFDDIHWGWDSPTSEIRGTLLGHWLSAAAHMVSETGDQELLGRANYIVSEVGRCQQSNGGRWAFPIPEKYLYWLKALRHPWAPQYVCHKNMMGLLDMYRLCGSQQALEILLGCADWFYDFTNDISRELMDDMMDCEETGGMMELFADLYGLTGEEKHLTLMRRYERSRLADGLLRGTDMLTNMHANATIPEILGYARAYEVTGERKYLEVAKCYWDQAVTHRAAFATGGQTSGEIWTPCQHLAERIGDKTQEHCTVYNMMRLSKFLARLTGEAQYADYYERNLLNGIYAQGYWADSTEEILMGPRQPEVTTVAYYLPLGPGSKKRWGSEFEHFWCCHCTLLQANATLHEHIYFKTTDGVAVSQFIPSRLAAEGIVIEQTMDSMTGGDMLRDEPVNREILTRPKRMGIRFKVQTDGQDPRAIWVRVPEWCEGELRAFIDGEAVRPDEQRGGYAAFIRNWSGQELTVHFKKTLRAQKLPGSDSSYAFLDGPVCLAGLTEGERMLTGDPDHPEGTILEAHDERQWQDWRTGYKTRGESAGIKFKPLYEVGHEVYTVYFPVKRG